MSMLQKATKNAMGLEIDEVRTSGSKIETMLALPPTKDPLTEEQIITLIESEDGKRTEPTNYIEYVAWLLGGETKLIWHDDSYLRRTRYKEKWFVLESLYFLRQGRWVFETQTKLTDNGFLLDVHSNFATPGSSIVHHTACMWDGEQYVAASKSLKLEHAIMKAMEPCIKYVYELLHKRVMKEETTLYKSLALDPIDHVAVTLSDP